MQKFRNIRNVKSLIVLMIFSLVICWSIGQATHRGNNENVDGDDAVAEGQYWISTHYFADSSPVNMWDSEFSNIDDDFERIKSDGFNSVIIMVPWREFQPEVDNEAGYNEGAFSKLDFICQKADEHGLGIILRVGYFCDYYDNRSGDDLYARYKDLVSNEKTQSAWLEYCSRVYSTVASYDCLFGAFICWEDFWSVVDQSYELAGQNDDSYELARDLNYSDYIWGNYNASDISSLFNVDSPSINDIYIPSRDSVAFGTFYDFYDEFLNTLLSMTQEVFPGISMEVRVDADLVVNSEGETDYYFHEKTYACDGADYTTIVYGIPMGFENNGEKVTWEEALFKTDYMLNSVYRNSGKKIFIDQFLFYDNTQGFEHNASLIDADRDDYLINCADTLLKYTNGYGIWTYKNYYNDAVANGEFAKGLSSWEASENVSVEEKSGSMQCRMSSGSEIKQNLLGKVSTTGDKKIVSLDVEPIGSNADIDVWVNGISETINIQKAGNYTVEFDDNGWGDLIIQAHDAVYVDTIKVYNSMQEGLLYGPDWEELECMESVRLLNESLKTGEVKPYETNVDNTTQNMRVIDTALFEGSQETSDNPWNTTAGVIEMEEVGEVIFLTPNTSVSFPQAAELTSLDFSYTIHPWVKENSDGAGLLLRLLNDEDEIIYEEEIIVSGEDEWMDYHLDITKCDGVTTIKLACNNGLNDDDACDWVMLKLPSADTDSTNLDITHSNVE